MECGSNGRTIPLFLSSLASPIDAEPFLLISSPFSACKLQMYWQLVSDRLGNEGTSNALHQLSSFTCFVFVATSMV